MDSSAWPMISVVIPVRNGAGLIAAAMRSALDQDYPGDLEVIVADGLSTDGTRGEALAVAEADGRVSLIENDRELTAAGLNAAIARSRGEVIVRCDAQARLPAGYIERAVEIMRDTGADVVGGAQAVVGESLPQRAIAIAMTTPLGTGGARFRIGGEPGPTDTVYLGVFRRTALERVGLFDEALVRNQDYELNHRIRRSGGTVFFHPDLSVAYTPRPTVGALFNQYRQYGDWKRKMLRRHPEALRARQLAPPLFVIGLMVAAVLLVTAWRLAAAVYVAAYAAALLATAIAELLRRSDRAALLSPLPLAAIHLGWGLGFLFSDGKAPEPEIPTLGGP